MAYDSASRRWGSCAAALAGLVLAIAPPALGQAHRESAPQTQRASSHPTPADRRQPPPQPGGAQLRTPQADNAGAALNRRGVEAAERQAVEAAKANRLAAKGFPFTVLQGLAGLAGVVFTAIAAVAAIHAARYAKRAAEHAEAGVKVSDSALDHARKTAAQDARAWVEIDAELVDFRNRPDCFFVSVELKLRNLGKTPAWKVGASVKPFFHTSGTINGGPEPKLEKFPSLLSPMMPGREQRQRFGVRFERKDLAPVEAECRGGEVPMLCIDAAVYYHVIGEMTDDARRVSSIRYIILPKPAEERRPVQSDWLRPGPDSLDEVRMSEVKGAQTLMS